MKVALWLAGACVAAAACGDNAEKAGTDAAPDALSLACDDTNMATSLAAVPGVSSVAEQPCGDYVYQPARCFLLTFDQPVRHDDPAGPHFGQKAWLIHRSCTAPMLIADWGYSQDLFYDDELSVLYKTNALWVEHRFQGASTPATWDWGALTIENGAHDMHAIITSLRALYHDRWVSTGASKGGITATYHRYFFPDDVDGSVPYVAPASRYRVDPNYQTHLAAVLPDPCAQKVRDYQIAALTTRRQMMLPRLTPSAPGYESVLLEIVVARLDWGFWQYYGAGRCAQVPTDASTDDQFFAFFDAFLNGPRVGPAVAATPANTQRASQDSLAYEWLTEQGFALQIGEHVQPLLKEPAALASMEDNFRTAEPSVELPAYNSSVTVATRAWVRERAKDMLLIYGQYDPWSGGALDPPTDPSSAVFYVPAATHGSAQISALPGAQQIDALAMTTRFFGRAPHMARMVDASAAGAVRARILDEKMIDAVIGRARRR